jgi:hypothetical protein
LIWSGWQFSLVLVYASNQAGTIGTPQNQEGNAGGSHYEMACCAIAGMAMIIAVGIGGSTAWYFGIITLVVLLGVIQLFGYSAARCPRCGQTWKSSFRFPWSLAVLANAECGDETETFVCRTCRLDIGVGLRDEK